MIRRLLIFCLLFVFCAMTNAQKADVVVLLDSTSVKVKTLSYYSCEHHQKFMLMNSNNANLANVVIGMDNDTELSRFEYVMTDALGNVLRKVKKSELQRFEYSRDLATDYYRLIAEVTPPSYPVIITKTEKIIRNANVLSYPSFWPQKQYGMNVSKAVYQIEWPEDEVNIRYKSMNMSAIPEVEQVGRNKTLRFTLTNLAPLTRVPYAPSLDEQAPYVLFVPEKFSYYGTTGSMSSWSSFGSWNHGLTVDRQLLPESHLEKVREVIADCHTEREKIAKLYEYMGKNTRYVSLQLGIGGYQPATAVSVANTGMGDCKGLSNYMYTLLKDVGIDSRLVVIGTEDPKLIPGFANVNQLNHMVLAVMLEQGKDTVWLECTNSKLSPGYIHEGISGHEALLLSSDGCHIVRVPEYADSLNLRHTDVRIAIRHDASADVTIDEVFNNHRYSDKFHLLKEKEQEQRTAISSWYKLPNTSFGSIYVKDSSKPFDNAQLKSHLDGVCAKYANLTGRRLFVPINPSHKGFSPVVIAATLSSQRLQMKISHGYRNEDDILIEIPRGCSVESLPANMDIEEEFGAFHQHVVLEDGRLRISQVFDIHRGTYAPEARKRLVEMQRNVQKAYNSRVVLVRDESSLKKS